MKRLSVLFLLLICSVSQAQPNFISLQQQWIDSVKTTGSASDFYWPEGNLIYSKITTNDTESLKQLIRSEGISGLDSYKHLQTFKHDDYRFVTVGKLDTKADPLLLLTGWRNVEGDWKKEIDVILMLETTSSEISQELNRILNQERTEWVKLANENNPEAHISVSYTEDATYFGNGQKSAGRDEIIQRYSYMENPNYQVDLEKEKLWKISGEYVLEVGRYFTGAERVGTGGIYVILWEEQDDENWMRELDFNF